MDWQANKNLFAPTQYNKFGHLTPRTIIPSETKNYSTGELYQDYLSSLALPYNIRNIHGSFLKTDSVTMNAFIMDLSQRGQQDRRKY